MEFPPAQPVTAAIPERKSARDRSCKFINRRVYGKAARRVSHIVSALDLSSPLHRIGLGTGQPHIGQKSGVSERISSLCMGDRSDPRPCNKNEANGSQQEGQGSLALPERNKSCNRHEYEGERKHGGLGEVRKGKCGSKTYVRPSVSLT